MQDVVHRPLTVKRLAMRVEDHPVAYGDFEGVISEGQYGAGTVMLWDHGTWMPEEPDTEACLRKGELTFSLAGRKLKGSWVLIRTAESHSYNAKRQRWLLIKHRDQFASARDILVEQPRSVRSNRLLAQIARDNHGNVAKAAQGDPASS